MCAGGEREATMQARRAKTSIQYIIACAHGCGSEDTPADRRRWLSGVSSHRTQDTGHITQDTDMHASRSLAT